MAWLRPISYSQRQHERGPGPKVADVQPKPKEEPQRIETAQLSHPGNFLATEVPAK